MWIFRSNLVIGDFTLPGWSSLWSGFAMVDDSTVAVLMATVLFVIPAAKKSDGKAILEARAFKDLPWNAILLFGGGFAMAAGFGTSGRSGIDRDGFQGIRRSRSLPRRCLPMW